MVTNKITLLTLIFILTLMFNGCSTGYKPKDQSSQSSSSEVDNPYLKKYTGGYTVEIKGISVTKIDGITEVYVLAQNGLAKWMQVKNDGRGGTSVESEESGTWTATETKISITTKTLTIYGKSETVTEEYILQNGTFVFTLSNDRYLKPIVNNN